MDELRKTAAAKKAELAVTAARQQPRMPSRTVSPATSHEHSRTPMSCSKQRPRMGTVFHRKRIGAGHYASTRTTQFYDRRRDERSLDEVERIVIREA